MSAMLPAPSPPAMVSTVIVDSEVSFHRHSGSPGDVARRLTRLSAAAASPGASVGPPNAAAALSAAPAPPEAATGALAAVAVHAGQDEDGGGNGGGLGGGEDNEPGVLPVAFGPLDPHLAVPGCLNGRPSLVDAGAKVPESTWRRCALAFLSSVNSELDKPQPDLAGVANFLTEFHAMAPLIAPIGQRHNAKVPIRGQGYTASIAAVYANLNAAPPAAAPGALPAPAAAPGGAGALNIDEPFNDQLAPADRERVLLQKALFHINDGNPSKAAQLLQLGYSAETFPLVTPAQRAAVIALHPTQADAPGLGSLESLPDVSPYVNPHEYEWDGGSSDDDGPSEEEDDDASLARAISVTFNTANLDPEVLRQLHLDPDNYENPNGPDARDFFKDLAAAICPWIYKIVVGKKRSTGSAFSNWNYRSIHALCRHDGDNAGSYASFLPIAKFALHVLSGKLVGDDRLSAFTGIARGIAIKKPNGSPRPLGIIEVLIRIAGAVGTRLYRPQLMGAMHKHDFGCAPGGPEIVAHVLRFLSDRGFVILGLDIKNAFNELDTVSMLRDVTATAPGLRPYLETLYARRRIVSYARDRDVPTITFFSNRGTIQGESTSGFNYDITYSKKITEELRHWADLGEGVFVITIHDDTFLACLACDAVFPASDRHKEIILPIGHVRQQAKEAVLYTGNDAATLASASAGAAQRQMRFTNNGIVAAGVPVGKDPFVLSHLNEVANGIVNGILPRVCAIAATAGLTPRCTPPPLGQGAHAAIPAPPPPGQAQPDPDALEVVGNKGLLQRLFFLVRATTSSRATHLLRSLPPALTEVFARRIDDATYDTVMYLLGHDRDALPTGALGVSSRARVFLPIAMGGLGFVSCVDSRFAAYTASVFNAAPHVNTFVRLMGDPAINGGASWAPAFRGLREALTTLVSPAFGGDKPDSLAHKLIVGCNAASASVAHPQTRQLQGNLMKKRHAAMYASLLQPDGGTPALLRAVLRSGSDRHSGDFLHSTGAHPLLKMQNIAFRDAVNFRLALPVVGMAPPQPGSGLAAAPCAQIRRCSSCLAPMMSNGFHAFARVRCPLAQHASATHALVAGAIRGAIAASRSVSAQVLTHHGVEGGHLRHLWELRNPLPAGVPVGDDGFPLHGVRADMQVLLDGQGGTIIAADVTTTAAVPIAAQPRFAANGDLEAPTIPQRLLSQSGAAAADGERDKRKLYGDRWNVVPAGSLSPLSFEVHGAASSSTHAFFERVAQSVFPGVGQGLASDFGGRRAAFISMLRQRTSVALQTANAAAIARWRRLCWNSSVLVGAGAVAG